MSGRWVDLREAAELLGTSTEAVHKRAARGSLRSERRDGRVLVWVDDGRTEGGREAQVDSEALLEAKDKTIHTLQEQLEAERRANEENRRLLAALIQRVPELEAPPEPTGPAETHEEPAQEPTEGGGVRVGYPPGGTGYPEGSARPRDTAEFPVRGSLTRPWWRRVFGR
jgi:hypothetical protein